MKLSDFVEILEELSIPFRYRSFKNGENPQTPYAVYYQEGLTVMNADNNVHQYIKEVTLELITDYKNEDLEDRVVETLSKHNLYFEHEGELYIDSEELYQVSYHIYLY